MTKRTKTPKAPKTPEMTADRAFRAVMIWLQLYRHERWEREKRGDRLGIRRTMRAALVYLMRHDHPLAEALYTAVVWELRIRKRHGNLGGKNRPRFRWCWPPNVLAELLGGDLCDVFDTTGTCFGSRPNLVRRLAHGLRPLKSDTLFRVMSGLERIRDDPSEEGKTRCV